GDVNYTADTSEQHQQIQPYRFEPYLDELSRQRLPQAQSLTRKVRRVYRKLMRPSS
ncbi:hypothetical protein NQZ68_033452, partial [Dissostichus eleginoides]